MTVKLAPRKWHLAYTTKMFELKSGVSLKWLVLSYLRVTNISHIAFNVIPVWFYQRIDRNNSVILTYSPRVLRTSFILFRRYMYSIWFTVGPCALDYTKMKTSDHFWTDPPADELVQRHRIHSGGHHMASGAGSPGSPKRPGLQVRSQVRL